MNSTKIEVDNLDTQNLTFDPDLNPQTREPKKSFAKILRQVFFFTCFSAGAALIQIGSFTLLNELCSLPYWPAYLSSLLLSIIFNFTFNRKVTFRSVNNIPRAFCLVVLYYLIFTPLSTMLGQNLTDIGYNEYLILICTMLINFVSEFFYQKLFVFDKTKDDDTAHAKTITATDLAYTDYKCVDTLPSAIIKHHSTQPPKMSSRSLKSQIYKIRVQE